MSSPSSQSEFTLANETEEKNDELGDGATPSMSISQTSPWVITSSERRGSKSGQSEEVGVSGSPPAFQVDHAIDDPDHDQSKLETCETDSFLEDLPTPSGTSETTFEFEENVMTSSLGLDQEFVSSLEWKEQSRHIFVLSEAGKPIYSRYGNEDKLVTLFGLLQALVSVVQDGNDVIRSIHVGQTNIVFLLKSPLILVCVSRISQCVGQIQSQLMYFYNQVVSILTAKQLHKIYEKRRNYDLRRLLAGSERLLTNLANLVDNDPSFMLGAIKCLPLPNSTREMVNQTIVQYTAKLKNVVFAVLIANNQLVTLVRMKKCFMHPMDLHLILNLIDSSESFKAAESWTPVCLPRFDSSGFVHAHVSYLADDCQACLLILTVDRDSFFILSEAKQRIVEKLRKLGCLDAINAAMANIFPTMSYIGVPEVRHFLYKLKSLAQFTAPALDIPYIDAEIAKHVQSVSTKNLQHGAIKILLTAFIDSSAEVATGGYPSNTAWESLKIIVEQQQIANPIADTEKVIVADAYELPDAYGFVSAQIPKYWQKHTPHLVVHVQMNKVNNITLHQKAPCCGYTQIDRSGCVPEPFHYNCYHSGHCQALSSGLDLQSLANRVAAANNGIVIETSDCMERTLGEFAYHKSLCLDPGRTVLISVPSSPVFTSYIFARAISHCIGELLGQLQDRSLLITSA